VSDRVQITEVGPREGFQFERRLIATADKARLIEALSRTGVEEIQAVSFVSRTRMPHVADAEHVMEELLPADGVRYTALWFSPHGFRRAQSAPGLTLEGGLFASASAAFAERNWGMDVAGLDGLNDRLIEVYAEQRLPVRLSVAAAFGCNFAGPVARETVLGIIERYRERIDAAGLELVELALSDTMAWANPTAVRELCAAVDRVHGDVPLRLHLHDTRGLGLANAAAGLAAGVRRFDAAIAGLGGCPFAGHVGAAGNIATEDLFFLCESQGLPTGLDADRLRAAVAVAEAVVGHASDSRNGHGDFAPLAARRPTEKGR
jgi:hydroxymethylglutaryl-CoA lyase